MRLSKRVGTFTDSVIRRMTRISNEYNAINLSQGFPDFDPPKELMNVLADIAHNGPHQYSITFGAQNLREALAAKHQKNINRTIDAEKEVLVTCGSTEAMMCAMMTICDPGDKVMVFSPFYENYGTDAILSGAEPIYIPLVPPSYEFDIDLIEQGFQQGAKAIIVCNPSNPCGKVFTYEELEAIGRLAVKYDAFVVTDEVYEYLVYEPYKHICMASLPGMYEHTITCNSLSKSYSITGWRLGYLIGPEEVVEVGPGGHGGAGGNAHVPEKGIRPGQQFPRQSPAPAVGMGGHSVEIGRPVLSPAGQDEGGVKPGGHGPDNALLFQHDHPLRTVIGAEEVVHIFLAVPEGQRPQAAQGGDIVGTGKTNGSHWDSSCCDKMPLPQRRQGRGWAYRSG